MVAKGQLTQGLRAQRRRAGLSPSGSVAMAQPSQGQRAQCKRAGLVLTVYKGQP